MSPHVERDARIELASEAWKATAHPLYQSRTWTVLQHARVVLSLLGEQFYQLTPDKTSFEVILESVHKCRCPVSAWRSNRC